MASWDNDWDTPEPSHVPVSQDEIETTQGFS